MIEASRKYLGEAGVIAYDYCPGARDLPIKAKSRIAISLPGVGTQIPSGPVIDRCNGFENDADEFLDGNQLRWQKAATNVGFDIYSITYDNGWDYVQRNALAVVELFEELAADGKISPDADVVLIGSSMGGLVSRYALQYMETNDIPHNVDLWVTNDSPLQGAYVPLGIQFLDEYYADAWENSAAKVLKSELLDTPFARQSLIHHYTASLNKTAAPAKEHVELFEKELGGTLGGFPSDPGIRAIAFANGRADGVKGRPGYRSQILKWTSKEFSIAGRFKKQVKKEGLVTITASPTSTGLKLLVDVGKDTFLGRVTLYKTTITFTTKVTLQTTVNASRDDTNTGRPDLATVFITKPIFKMNGKDVDMLNRNSVLALLKSVVRAKIPKIARSIWDEFATLALTSSAQRIVDSASVYLKDNPEFKFKEAKVSSEFSYEGSPGGLGNKSEEAINIIADTKLGAFSSVLIRDHNYIPVKSALMISGPPGEAFDPLSVLAGTVGPPDTPFDAIHFSPGDNTDHLSPIQYEDGLRFYEIVTNEIVDVVKAGLN